MALNKRFLGYKFFGVDTRHPWMSQNAVPLALISSLDKFSHITDTVFTVIGAVRYYSYPKEPH